MSLYLLLPLVPNAWIARLDEKMGSAFCSPPLSVAAAAVQQSWDCDSAVVPVVISLHYFTAVAAV